MARNWRPERDDEMLTPRQARWVAEYVATSSKTKASTAAGYAGVRDLLDTPHVRKAVAQRMETIMKKKDVTAERVVDELAKVAFANIDDFVDDNYAVRQKPKRRKMAAVSEVTTVTTVNRDDKSRETERVHLKMHSKMAALDSLGKHFGIFAPEKVEIGGDLAERLERAFERLGEQGATPAAGGEKNDG